MKKEQDEVERMSQVWLTLTYDTELSRYVTDKDREVFRKRCVAEGLTFLTVTLPAMGKWLESILLDPTRYTQPLQGFACVKGEAYPQFLARAWETVVETVHDQGTDFRGPIGLYCRVKECTRLSAYIDQNLASDELEEKYGLRIPVAYAGAGAVNAIRQLTLMYYKTKLPYTKEQVDRVHAAFLATEDEIRQFELDHPRLISGATDLEFTHMECGGIHETDSGSGLLTRAGMIVKRLLSGFNPREITPRHGSGASACKQTPWERYAPKIFVPRLDRVFPYSDYFFSGGNHLVDDYKSLEDLPTIEDPMARVVYVPKDSRGPRVISCEPAELMFIQQGLMTKLYDALDKYPRVRQQVSCLDQERNRILAEAGSVTGSHGTLDLKEASDRVTCWLVRRLFPSDWVEALMASRSSGAVLPDGSTIEYRKFAPMGSAVCFPVEAICFWAITLAAIMPNVNYLMKVLFRRTSKPVPNDLRISIFGDDIIVPTAKFNLVIEALEAVGLKVNRTKSYNEGFFRESCGGDYFLGWKVTPVRCGYAPRTVRSKHGRLAVCDVTVQWFNNLAARYGSHLAEKFQSLIHEWYGLSIPITDDFTVVDGQPVIPSGGVKLIGLNKVPGYCRTRWDHGRGKESAGCSRAHVPILHRHEVYTVTRHPVYREVNRNSWSYVLASLLTGASPVQDCFALAKRTKYKYGWVKF